VCEYYKYAYFFILHPCTGDAGKKAKATTTTAAAAELSPFFFVVPFLISYFIIHFKLEFSNEKYI
jgi:hypothetical protein